MYCYVEAEFENVNSFRGSLEAIQVTTSCNYCCKYFVPYSYICSVNVALYVNIYIWPFLSVIHLYVLMFYGCKCLQSCL